mgnify:CR=1 FL=1
MRRRSHLTLTLPSQPGTMSRERVAVLRAGRLAVLAVGDQDVVHRLRHGKAALITGGVGALGEDPGGALLDAGLAQQERERHASPLAAARGAVRAPDALPSGRAPLGRRVARALDEQDARR